MYVKEDLIIPHTVSFYDLIVQKARGKSGPLFHFDVHEDVRMQSDATVEKDESHAGAASGSLAEMTEFILICMVAHQPMSGCGSQWCRLLFVAA